MLFMDIFLKACDFIFIDTLSCIFNLLSYTPFFAGVIPPKLQIYFWQLLRGEN